MILLKDAAKSVIKVIWSLFLMVLFQSWVFGSTEILLGTYYLFLLSILLRPSQSKTHPGLFLVVQFCFV